MISPFVENVKYCNELRYASIWNIQDFISYYSRKCKCDKFDSLCHDYAHTSNPMVFCEHSRWNQVIMYFTAAMQDHNRKNEGDHMGLLWKRRIVLLKISWISSNIFEVGFSISYKIQRRIISLINLIIYLQQVTHLLPSPSYQPQKISNYITLQSFLNK